MAATRNTSTFSRRAARFGRGKAFSSCRSNFSISPSMPATFLAATAASRASAAAVASWTCRASRTSRCMRTSLRVPLTNSRACFSLLRFCHQAIIVSPRPQHGNERFLGNVHLSDLFHPFLAFLLFFPKLAFAGDIAAVTFRRNIFRQRFDRLPRDDLTADGRLDRNLEKLLRDDFLEF